MQILAPELLHGISRCPNLRQGKLGGGDPLRHLSIGIFIGQSLKPVNHMLEAVQQLGRKHAAFSPEDHIH